MANKKTLHQTQSFAQLTGETNRAALKPYIQEQIGLMGQQLLQNLYQMILQERHVMQVRQLAFENLLKKHTDWFNEDVLAMEIAEIEDKSENLDLVDTAAEGDKVRLSFQAKPSTRLDWTEPSKLAIHSLGTKNAQGTVQTHEELEKEVIGMKVGETREFLIPEVGEKPDEPENTRIKVTVMRVSRRKVTVSTVPIAEQPTLEVVKND